MAKSSEAESTRPEEPSEASASSPAPPKTEPKSEPDPAPLPASSALVLAWTIVALLHATLVITVFEATPVIVWFAVGHLLVPAALSGLTVFAWERVAAPRWPALWWLPAVVVATSVAALVLPDDLDVFVHRLVEGSLATVLLGLVVVAAGASFPLSFVVATWRRGRAWRAGFAVVAVALAITNHFILAHNYPGLHLMAVLLAVTLLAGSLDQVAVPRIDRRARAGAFILVVAIGTPSLFVTIPGQALTELLRNPGAVFAPFLGRLKTSNDVPPAAPSTSAEWFEDRSGLPAIAASEPPLIPDDAIVLLVTIDALRHELLEEEKYRKKLPNLFRLRDESVYFTEARAPSSATSPSLSAIFTGRFYSGLYWTKWKKGRGRGKYFLGDEKRDRFTHILSARSIDTVVFLTTDGLRNSYGICGGFSEEPRASKKRQVPARAVFDAMIKNLENDSAGAKFFYTHLMEPHAPYNLAGKKGSPFKRYLGEVALAGRELGRFIGRLKQMGLYDRVVLIVGADHGEAFGEHNTHKHASTLYEELLRVPLFIRVPSVESRRVTEPVSLADLGPTILDLFGSATPASFLGQSLTPFLRGKDPKLERPLVAESGRHVRVMYFRDRYKLIEDRRRGLIELYNLELDPGELNNRYDPEDPESRERLATLQKFFTTHELKREGYKLPYRK